MSTYGQEHNIYHIKFDYYHAMRIPNHHVSVEFLRYGDSISVHLLSEPMKALDNKWNHTKIDTTFNLAKSDFDKIVTAVKQVNCVDITNGMDVIGLDGSTCELIYGGMSTGVSYKVPSPDSDTEKRNLNDFMFACKAILHTVELDPKEIF
ncbi:hypothetical protein KM029_22870 [Flammeovirga kamogawensis]|uniref:Uncharacterized protein n=1 Tax=Flammeovirga kamogawensis TaxID=373891 RepID=A0ABX8H184_9BACT|nr:hypothetical protein [Flammeovirga kamogawensis]QWG09453.1 hypothetical protein KM029_22870 [Flammeovirga kamogawensis]